MLKNNDIRVHKYSNYFVITMRVVHQSLVNYCYLVIDQFSRNAVAFDPAWELEKIEGVLDGYDAILISSCVTHHHRDHIDLAEAMSIRHAVAIHMSQQAVEFYEVNIQNLITFSGEENIKLLGISVKPIITPGHTRGSTCYLVGDSLFTGDTLFIEGCGICIQRGASPHDMFKSLTRLKSILPGKTRICAGHNYGREPGERLSYLLAENPYLNIDDQESFVEYRMRETSSLRF